MSDFNPYLEAPDVSEEAVTKATGEEAQQPEASQETAATRHIFVGPDGKELPAEVQEGPGRYLTPYNKNAGALPAEFKAIRGLFEFFAGFSNFQSSGTLLLSVAEVVDGLSDGLLAKVYRLHEAERRLIWTHMITRLGATSQSILNAVGAEIHMAYEAEIPLYFETLMDITKWYQEGASKEYLDACAALDKEPDHDFVQSGMLTERTHFQKVPCITLGQRKMSNRDRIYDLEIIDDGDDPFVVYPPEPYEIWEDYVAKLRRERFKWGKRALCIGVDMYPTYNRYQKELAQSYCAVCPVQEECLYLSLVGQEEYGVWGGTTEAEREELIAKLTDVVGDYKKEWDPASGAIIGETVIQHVRAMRTKKDEKIPEMVSTTEA